MHFRRRVAQESERISVDKLADDLDVDTDTLRQLVWSHPALTLLSADSRSVVTVKERETLLRKLCNHLSGGVIRSSAFAADNKIDEHCVAALMEDVDGEMVVSDGHIFRKTYEQRVTEKISGLLRQSLSNLLPVDVVSQELPGAPPTWFILRVLRHVLKSGNLTDAYLIKENSKGASCHPKQLIEQNRDVVINDLQSGKLMYANLREFQADFPEFYSTVEEAERYVRDTAKVTMVDVFAISVAREHIMVNDAMQSLIKNGSVDITDVLGAFPEHLRSSVWDDIECDIIKSFEKETETQARRVGNFLVKPEIYDSELDLLFDYAEAEAQSQWQQLREKPEKDVKFSLTNITGRITQDQRVLGALAKETATAKAIEERFWATISRQEAENEVHFCEFWTDRVQSRFQIYAEGLAAVEDEKLRDQLSETLVLHAQKELIPETMAKARSQGLVLSRRSRKNLMAKELVEMDNPTTIAGVLVALKKLNKKQGMEPVDSEKMQDAKQAMIGDMVRRMQKQKKSDGPVLFLTLVLVLFAKQHHGVLYATGKFAPRLLKQLKSTLPAEQHEQMEKWKEAAKTSSLTAEDRAAMKLMAEA